jgi:hypothetical protein
MPFRFKKATRRRDENEWRIVTVRAKRRIPILGSVGLRAVRRLTPLPPQEPRVAKILDEVRRRRRLARAIGIVSLLSLLTAGWMIFGARSFECLQPGKKPCFPNGFAGHVAALEFARTGPEVEAIVADIGHINRDVMRRQLNRDFIFIVLYLVLYLLLAVILFRATSFAPLLVVITVAAAVSTAGFDVLENVRTLKVLNLPLASLDGAQVAGILDAALIKWTLAFVTIALLSLAFRHSDGLSKLLRGLFLLTAVMGLAGLVFHPLIPLTMFPLLAGLIVLILSGLFWPLRLIRNS